MGPQPSVANRAAEVGVAATAPYSKLDLIVSAAIVKGVLSIPFLPAIIIIFSNPEFGY